MYIYVYYSTAIVILYKSEQSVSEMNKMNVKIKKEIHLKNIYLFFRKYQSAPILRTLGKHEIAILKIPG